MFRRADQSVTIPDEGDIILPEIPVERIRAYEVASVPAPANLWGAPVAPVRQVESVKVKTADGWAEL